MEAPAGGDMDDSALLDEQERIMKIEREKEELKEKRKNASGDTAEPALKRQKGCEEDEADGTEKKAWQTMRACVPVNLHAARTHHASKNMSESRMPANPCARV